MKKMISMLAQDEQQQESKLLTTKQLATVLTVKESWLIHNRMSDNPIPFTKFGHLVRYDMNDVYKWIKKQKVS